MLLLLFVSFCPSFFLPVCVVVVIADAFCPHGGLVTTFFNVVHKVFIIVVTVATVDGLSNSHWVVFGVFPAVWLLFVVGCC